MQIDQIGLQLYSVRRNCEKDLDATLSAISQIGIKCVELAGFYGHSPEEFAALLQKHNLKAIAAHVSIDDIQNNYDQVKQDYRTLGIKYIIVPWLEDDYTETLENVKSTEKLFRTLADKLARDGFIFGFHNHWREFVKEYDDKTYAWQYLTKPYVTAEIDLAWCLRGNHDPITEMKRLSKTCKLLHVKDYDPTVQFSVPVGEGKINWQAILETADHIGVEYYILELDADDDPLGAVERSFVNFKKYAK